MRTIISIVMSALVASRLTAALAIITETVSPLRAKTTSTLDNITELLSILHHLSLEPPSSRPTHVATRSTSEAPIHSINPSLTTFPSRPGVVIVSVTSTSIAPEKTISLPKIVFHTPTSIASEETISLPKVVFPSPTSPATHTSISVASGKTFSLPTIVFPTQTTSEHDSESSKKHGRKTITINVRDAEATPGA